MLQDKIPQTQEFKPTPQDFKITFSDLDFLAIVQFGMTKDKVTIFTPSQVLETDMYNVYNHYELPVPENLWGNPFLLLALVTRFPYTDLKRTVEMLVSTGGAYVPGWVSDKIHTSEYLEASHYDARVISAIRVLYGTPHISTAAVLNSMQVVRIKPNIQYYASTPIIEIQGQVMESNDNALPAQPQPKEAVIKPEHLHMAVKLVNEYAAHIADASAMLSKKTCKGANVKQVAAVMVALSLVDAGVTKTEETGK